MMNVFTLVVLSAERTFYEGDCASLVIPTTEGKYGIQANHSNMIAAITPGKLKFTKPDGEEVFAEISDGIVKVENNHVLILVDKAGLRRG